MSSFCARPARHLFTAVLGFALTAMVAAKAATKFIQQVKPADTAAHGDQDVTLLAPGKPIERGIKGGETHVYRITLTAGQFLHAVVDQRGINAVVTLFGPDGKRIVEVDSPTGDIDSPYGTRGPGPVRAIAEKSGSYRLEIRSLEKGAKPVRYQARIEELRVATQRDRSYIAAERLIVQAELLRGQGTPDTVRKSLEVYQEAMRLRQAAGDRLGEAYTFTYLGLAYDALGEYENAIEHYNQALLVFRAFRDSRGEAFALNHVAALYAASGDNEKALEYFRGALLITKSLGPPSAEALALGFVARTYRDLGDIPKALESLNQALSIYKAESMLDGEAVTLNDLGTIYRDSGEKEKALKCYNEALPLMVEVRDHQGEVATLNSIGLVYDDLGEEQQALAYFDRALPIAQRAGDRSGEAAALNDIAHVYSNKGDEQKVLEYLGRALLLLRADKNQPWEAVTLSNIGASYMRVNDPQKALEYYTQALPTLRAVGDHFGIAVTLNNIGCVYLDLGQSLRALELFNSALPLMRDLKNLTGEANSLNFIGGAYYGLGDKQRALEYYSQTLRIVRETKDPFAETVALNNIAMTWNDLGDKRKALEYYIEALPILRRLGYRYGEGRTLANIGLAYDGLRDPAKAVEYYNEALLIIRAVKDESGEARTLNNIGIAYDNLRDRARALDFYKQAISKIESTRATATLDEIKGGITQQAAEAYGRASLLLMYLGRQSQAFDFTERARSRTLLDQIGNVRPRQLNTTNAQLIQEEQTLASELSSLEHRLRQERDKPGSILNRDLVSSINNQLASVHRLYEDLLLRLKLTNSEYASLKSVDTLTLSEVQMLLNSETTLLSYFVTPEKTLAFLVTRSSFRAIELPVKEAELTNSIKWFRGFASLRDPQPGVLKQLHGWLIAPLSHYIKTRNVGIIPHGVLHYLPFAALTNGQHYFGEEHALFYLPSASVLPFIQKKAKPVGDHILAVAQSQAQGLPVLQHADGEAQAVASLYSTQAITTREVSKSGFLKQAGDYSIIHIAAHAELNTFSPLFSRIVLGSDKKDKESGDALEVREVYDLDLSKASLVVLSACETQLGAQGKGDDIVGLNRAFIYAGTPSVIASLWTVDDESTRFLMEAFYTHLKAGMSKAGALRAAQSDTRKQYQHPYHWAAFVLTGDPGRSAQRRKPSVSIR
jgi:CHAT domain-containing protein/Tfp pilus assembly protein PilF